MEPIAAGRPGVFDTDAVSWGWFDVCGEDQGWFDRDLLVYPAVVPPPPPPPPPRPPRPRPSGGGGGGGGAATPYCPPDWLAYALLKLEDECDDLCGDEGEVDFALIHVTEGAPVRALASGVVESFVDDRGRTSLSLTTDDGARHWYADLGKVEVADGTRVRARQVIARTRPNASPLPAMTEPLGVATLAAPPETASPASTGALLPPHDPKPIPDQEPPPSRPAQVVFVEAPPAAPPPTPPPPPLRVYRLLPIPTPPAPQTEPAQPDQPTAAPILRTVAKLGLIAALIAALAWFDSRPPAPPPRPTKPRSLKQPKKKRRKRSRRRGSR